MTHLEPTIIETHPHVARSGVKLLWHCMFASCSGSKISAEPTSAFHLTAANPLFTVLPDATMGRSGFYGAALCGVL